MLLNLHLFALDSCLMARVSDDDNLFIAKLNALKCEQGYSFNRTASWDGNEKNIGFGTFCLHRPIEGFVDDNLMRVAIVTPVD